MGTTTDAGRCVGVVLAGGRSRRMGRDKAALPWRGATLLDHQIEVLHAAGADRVLVSGDRPRHAGIADRQPDAGPLAGLASVAAAITGDAPLLVVPVDMPRLTAALLRRLRSAVDDAACTHFEGHVLPFGLRLDEHSRATLDRLLRAAAPRQRSLRALQSALDARALALGPAEAGGLVDCNTPEAWREMIAAAADAPAPAP